MKRLLQLLYGHRALVVFILLELTSVVLFKNPKRYQTASAFMIGRILSFTTEIKSYPFLRVENANLLNDNARLRNQLLQRREAAAHLQTPIPEREGFIPARVVNNSIIGSKNYLTLNKGALQGIAPGMGVISAAGIVGRVKAVSDHFATVISLLHTSMQVSAKLDNSGVLGTVQWPGQDPFRAQLLHVPRHVQVAPGDSVVTSSYNAVFFAGTMIGHVKRVVLRKEAHFYDIELALSTDFSTLQHVYVVNNALRPEKYTLEQNTRKFYE